MFSKEIFGQRLIACAISRKVQQETIAHAVKLDKTSISKIMNGKQGVSMEQACNLADFFEVSLDYLAGRTDSIHGYHPPSGPL